MGVNYLKIDIESIHAASIRTRDAIDGRALPAGQILVVGRRAEMQIFALLRSGARNQLVENVVVALACDAGASVYEKNEGKGKFGTKHGRRMNRNNTTNQT